MRKKITYIKAFTDIDSRDTPTVGGKNASLGEMIQNLSSKGIPIPDGFATTADAYREFLEVNHLIKKIESLIQKWKKKHLSLKKTGSSIRQLIMKAKLQAPFALAIEQAYRDLSDEYGQKNVDVAVRSSATAEDLPEASFAGQQDTFLNIKGNKELLKACKKCLASLFTDRAIIYRENKGFDHLKVALSIGIQKMVRSDKAGSGVLFSIDTETGFPRTVLINAGWGLGELVVKGEIDPDEYRVFKPLLRYKKTTPIIKKNIGSKTKKLVYATKGKKTTRLAKTTKKERMRPVLEDSEILRLAKFAVCIEDHYKMPMDIEWAKDGTTGEIFIVQARPETVHSQAVKSGSIKNYRLVTKGEKIAEGLSIGKAISVGKVCKLKNPRQEHKFLEKSILVTSITDPDWLPIMKKASAIITDHGGRTSHAAIVSRELGLPAVVGTVDGTKKLKNDQVVTVSCAEGDKGFIYKGALDFEVDDLSLEKLPRTKVDLMLNMADPATAMKWWPLPSKGVGLARMEFIISNHIKIHPMALVRWKKLNDKRAKKKITDITEGYINKSDYFIDKLAFGIATIAASQCPHPVIVRLSDFKTNEYAGLIGGKEFEPYEENPMIGWRGASRYYHPDYEEGFALECRAIEHARNTLGFTNIKVMIPFCRTLKEADSVIKTMKRYGLKRGENGLEFYMMCEIPSNVILADSFAEKFDGFSIGSNDLTQLTLGVDRDSERIASLFDEEDPAVLKMVADVIEKGHKHGCKVGICGQAPSDKPNFAKFLVEAGIDSISVTPDSFVDVLKTISRVEKGLRRGSIS